MSVITKELLLNLAEKLKKDEQFLKDSKALTATILLQDEEQCAYISFYHGKLMEVQEGHCLWGSDYRIFASCENWKKALTESNPAYGIFELKDVLLDFDGNIFAFSGNAKAFYTFWLTLRKAYMEIQEGME